MHLNEKLNAIKSSFIHSGYFYNASSSPLLLSQRRSRHSKDTVSEFNAKAPQASASVGLAQGPNMATRVGFEPATRRMKGDESTNEPPHTTICYKGSQK